MDAFTMLQVAVAVMLGNVLTRILFKGWERVKADRVDWSTAAFYIGPLGLLILVLIGSKG
jgi:hypothetical protein